MPLKYPNQIPALSSSMTPKEKIGIKNAHKLKTFVEEGLSTDTLPLYNGLMNRKKVAENLGFGRSAYAQNEWIKDIADWADRALEGKPRKTGGGGKTELTQELAQENQRLKDLNVALKVEVDEARRKLRELDYLERAIESGDIRLPW